MSAISALIRSRASRIDLTQSNDLGLASFLILKLLRASDVHRGYAIARFTSLYWRIRLKFTMCRKFQLASTSTPATVAAAMWRASARIFSPSAPFSVYLLARISTSRVTSILSR